MRNLGGLIVACFMGAFMALIIIGVFELLRLIFSS